MDHSLSNARVIITYGRSLIALVIAQSLGQRGAEIIGCDDIDMTVLNFSKFVTKNHIYASPHDDPDGFIRDLADIVRRNKPKDDRPYILIPSFYEARLIAKNRDRFGDTIILACPSFDAINAVDPKDHLAKSLQDIETSAPKTWFPNDKNDLNDIIESVSYPVFIKPPDQVGGRGITSAKDEDELRAAFDTLKADFPDKQILIQETAEGQDYCFCGLFDHGKLVASMVYHNTQKFPNETGPGVVRETVNATLFNPIAEDLMAHVGWHGVCEIDFMWTGKDSDTPMMIEVNPRFWAGLDHSVKSGVDFPYMLYQLFAKGHVTDISEATVGYKTSLPLMSELSAIEALFDQSVNFDKLDRAWPTIKQQIKDLKLNEAADLFKTSLEGSVTIDEAVRLFQSMITEAREAEKISLSKDDPFVGLGALFILESLYRHGTLPPEVSR